MDGAGYHDGRADQWFEDWRAVRAELPDHGGTCGGTDEEPAELDQRGLRNPCLRCRVLLSLKLEDPT